MDNDIGGRKATNTTILTSCLETPYFRYLRRPYRAALQVTYEAICKKPHADIPRRTRHLDKGNILHIPARDRKSDTATVELE